MKVVRPAMAASIASMISFSVSGSMAEVGSSSRSTVGSRRRARAMAMRWRWPPERFTPPSPRKVS
jgi:hypothetical protein